MIKGLNIEGVCLSKHCEAYKKCVIAGLGMVSFCLHADVVNCPECHMQIQPRTCAFYECMWGFDGRKSESGGPKDVSNAWTVNPKTCYSDRRHCQYTFLAALIEHVTEMWVLHNAYLLCYYTCSKMSAKYQA